MPKEPRIRHEICLMICSVQKRTEFDREAHNMANTSKTFLQGAPKLKELNLLKLIADDGTISQERLARRIHLAPSMVNRYIKRLSEDGIIEFGGSNHKTRTYHLTKRGMNRKNELFLEYLLETIRLYKEAKSEFSRIFLNFNRTNLSRVVLFGAGDTAEVIINAVEEMGLKVVGVVDSDKKKQGRYFSGRQILSPDQIEILDPDVVIITSLGYQKEIYESIKGLETGNIRIQRLRFD